MPAFVVSDDIEVFVAEYQGPLGAKQNLVQRLAETLLRHIILVAAGRQQCCFVHQVCQVGAYHSHRRACHGDKVHIGSQRNLTRVNFEDSKASIPIWSIYRHAPVKAAWTQQRYVESIRTVSGANNHHCLACIEAVQLYEQPVQCLLTLIIGVDACTSLPAYRVDLVDENDAGRCFLRLVEQVANTTGANTHQHFDKLRAGHRVERDAGFTGNGSCQQGFTCAWRAYQQYTTWDLATQALKLLRRLKKLNHFFQLELCLVYTRDICKRHGGAVFKDKLGTPLDKNDEALLALRGEVADDNAQVDQQRPGQQCNQQVHKETVI